LCSEVTEIVEEKFQVYCIYCSVNLLSSSKTHINRLQTKG